jgi:long-chain acyl-CoA synthetase
VTDAVPTSSVFADRPWLSAYAHGVPDDIGEPRGTLLEIIHTSAKRYPDTTALVFFGAGTTYRALSEQIDRAAEGLRRLGVKAGDRVAIILPNCPQHIVAFYAVLRLGAIVVEHNPLYTPRELRHQFEDHGAEVVIAWDKVCDTVQGFPADIPVRTLIAVDITRGMPLGTRIALRLPIPAARRSREALTAKPGGKGIIRWEQLLKQRRISKKVPRPTADDIAVLQYTSGTTGSPKGAILTHRNLRANAEQGRAWVPGLKPGEENFYAVLPMFHAYGLTLCLTFAMSIGATLVLFPKFDVDLVLKAARRHPPTFLPAVPPIYERLARAAEEHGADLSSVRFAISGAMALPPATVERWERVTGGLLVEGYGMTETSPVAIGNPIGPSRRVGTVGVPFPSTEIRVVDPEDPAKELGFGERGELLIRGPQVFSGYWNRPDATAEALLPGGWIRTGDIVEVSEDGYVRIVDRIKELIITGGFNVAPSEVEEALGSHPDVLEAAAVGLPGENGGEEVAAAVVLREGAALDAPELREYTRRFLTPYKIPRRIVAVDELPKSMIGKVLRRKVRDLLLEQAG